MERWRMVGSIARSRRVPSKQTHEHAADLDAIGADSNRLERRVRGAELHLPAHRMESLERGLAVHDRDHRLARGRALRTADDHDVAVPDPVLDHRVPLDAKRVSLAGAEHGRRDLDLFRVLDGFDGTPRGDGAEEWDRRGGRTWRGPDACRRAGRHAPAPAHRLEPALG